jgi:hypothetical protein
VGEARLARLADGADGLADHGAQHHQVAAGGLHLGHLRGEIGGAALVGGLLGQLHADGLQAVFGAAHHLQAELVVLVDGAHLLGALFLHQARRAGARLVVVGHAEGELEVAVGLLEHLARR